MKAAEDMIAEFRKEKLFAFEPIHEFLLPELMKRYASQAVRLALETCAEKAKPGSWMTKHGKVCTVKKGSILSLEQSIIDKLK